MNRTDWIQVKEAIRHKFTSIGCYPLYLVTSDGGALCPDCGRVEFRSIVQATKIHPENDGWQVIGVEVNWEDPMLYCDHCNKRIESAYAEESKETSHD